MSLSILIAGEHYPFLYGLEALTVEILGKNHIIELANTYTRVTQKLKQKKYDILVTDIFMSGVDGFTIIERSLALNSELKILVVSMNPSIFLAIKCMEAGAYGYISSRDSGEKFKTAIEYLYLGKRYFPKIHSQFNSVVSKTKKSLNPFELLSQRELSVMLLMLEGKGIKEISNVLSIGISTASTYRIRIFNKLKITNIAELINMAHYFNVRSGHLKTGDGYD